MTHFPIKLIQLTDMHLTGEIGKDGSYVKFLQVLALAKKYNPTHFILTGDLVNGGERAGYDWLFEQMTATGVPFFAIAGNHDVTIEQGEHLPFDERTFLPTVCDKRLLDCQKVAIGDWQLLFLGSAIAGQIGGKLSQKQLDWLKQCLIADKITDKKTLVILHHHPCVAGSLWIDEYRLANGDALIELLNTYAPHSIIVCGHIHQAHQIKIGTTTLLTAPAVSRQFLPFVDEFALDDLPSGFRIIDLAPTFDTQVVRLLLD